MLKRATAPIAALAMMVLGTGLVLASHQFPDVPTSQPFHDDIEWLVENGITTGYANGNFGPQDSVTRRPMAPFLKRTTKPSRRWLVPKAQLVRKAPPVPPAVRLAPMAPQVRLALLVRLVPPVRQVPQARQARSVPPVRLVPQVRQARSVPPARLVRKVLPSPWCAS